MDMDTATRAEIEDYLETIGYPFSDSQSTDRLREVAKEEQRSARWWAEHTHSGPGDFGLGSDYYPPGYRG